ncbi:MAG: hypothetical protein CMK32_04370 [Porticoccaceae bacterium]|nr:hypothetical protein [Porticoccaceae bacterium]
MAKNNESTLGRIYRQVYEGLCGKHPRPRFWHFQYLDAFYLYRSLKRLLPNTIGDTVLDVGCGEMPYRMWFSRPVRHIGIDTQPGEGVDYVIDGVSQWPLESESVDIVLCTQVLEHVEDLPLVLEEISRVLRSEGTLIASFPFLYNEHGAPNDYRRFSAHGAKLLWPGWRVVSLERQGGVGSTLAVLWLNWLEVAMNRSFVTRILKAPLLPFWIIGSLLANLLGLLLDRLDGTESFYSNVLIVLEKTTEQSERAE